MEPCQGASLRVGSMTSHESSPNPQPVIGAAATSPLKSEATVMTDKAFTVTSLGIANGPHESGTLIMAGESVVSLPVAFSKQSAFMLKDNAVPKSASAITRAV